ncbi:MAG: hypothetical protein L0Y35_06250, partial [Flammeovirgaceae bacterium]|nr:hypothetical protein [Flammeovirgaceae bacterium]
MEQKQVAFMLATGFFLGVFVATYQITAESLFINKLSDQLSKAILVAGILGIGATFIFSFFQNYIRFAVLTQTSIGIIFSIIVTFYSLLHFGDPALHDQVLFLQFCMIGPASAILLLSYWGTFGRLFNFKQSKSIIGWIDTGQLVAAIIASFLIPATSFLLPETTDYLVVSCGSLLMVGVLQFVISRTFVLAKNDPKEIDKEVRKETSLLNILSNRYILLLSLFLLVSMVTLMF